MSLSNGFGKKQTDKELDLYPLIETWLCPSCQEELVKLELVIGEDVIEEGARYYKSYWILICPKCGARYKKLDQVYKYLDQEDPGRNTLRWK